LLFYFFFILLLQRELEDVKRQKEALQKLKKGKDKGKLVALLTQTTSKNRPSPDTFSQSKSW
jgi:hypothetical protein